SSGAVVLGVKNLGYFNAHSSSLVGCTIQNAAGPGSATLSGPTTITVPTYTAPLNPSQPGVPVPPSDGIDDGDARFSASVYRVGDVLYAVHAMQTNSKAALQWFKINATNFSLIQTGVITNSNLHLFYPSIAANDAGIVV